MKKNLILTHDLGTSGNKATLFTPNGEVVAHVSHRYETNYLKDQAVEQNPEDWWTAVCSTTTLLMEQSGVEAEDISVVTFSGQMMGVVAVDRQGHPLRPALIWADMRAEKEANQVVDTFGMKNLYDLTGNRVTSSYSGPKMSWIKNHEPEIYNKTYKFLQAKDYICTRMTGVFATDYSDASGTSLMDIHEKIWSEKLIQEFGIDQEKLPDLHSSTDVVGGVTTQAAQQTGLKEGTPVVIGGADGCCAALGAGITDEGDAFNYIGSSSWISMASETPLLDERMRTFNFIHLDSTKYIPIGTMQSAGSAFEWVKSQFYKDCGENVYRTMNAEASQSPVGSGNLIFLPYLLGERSPWWNAKSKGGWIGLSLSHTRGDMVRAVMEGVSLNLKLILDVFVENGKSFDDLWLFGGGANSHVWKQILADLYGIPLKVPEKVDETTSMGAAVAGGIGVGLLDRFDVSKDWCKQKEYIQSKHENTELYKEIQDRFVRVYQDLEPNFNDWS